MHRGEKRNNYNNGTSDWSLVQQCGVFAEGRGGGNVMDIDAYPENKKYKIYYTRNLEFQ